MSELTVELIDRVFLLAAAFFVWLVSLIIIFAVLYHRVFVRKGVGGVNNAL